MKNVHIELVKQWLADPTTVSPEELKANAKAAYDAYDAAFAPPYAAAYDYAYAAFFVKRYEELTK